ncbi:hypothetical protein PGT21_034328 [Puccinia graminis f. sp. tritici]|uniref:THIF-type NAD/FAD binding fold domain-containing protein n=1 Tax=Puccinia graminis f. sp. tritici TaxID=56615 RepID=A0A5B0MN62_PUCGR|nr:hypothetical protein PGT21_034328 [Puccinia graminis f. sp. tritici]
MAHAHPSANFSHHETRLPSDGWSSSGEPLTENTSNQLTPHTYSAGRMAPELNEKNGIDEEEAALYDRQIRLWGVEAQNRMRRSSVLMINLRGISTEACKNIVLAGVGSITILDPNDVSPEDLGAGFFFREEDIGQKEKVNSICRRFQKPFFAAASLGIHGYIFADLLDHAYISEREKTLDNGEIKKTSEKRIQQFVPFDVVQKAQLNHVTPKRVKKVSPLLWASLALFELQSRHNINYPEGDEHASELINISDKLLETRGIDKSLLPQDLLRQLAITSRAEFIPSCAVIGSILSQEVLNALGGKQAPLANFLVFNGEKCAGDIYALGIQRTQS